MTMVSLVCVQHVALKASKFISYDTRSLLVLLFEVELVPGITGRENKCYGIQSNQRTNERCVGRLPGAFYVYVLLTTLTRRGKQNICK